jgi:hypothetical protein
MSSLLRTRMIEDLRIRNYSPLFLYRTSLEKDWRVEHIPPPEAGETASGGAEPHRGFEVSHVNTRLARRKGREIILDAGQRQLSLFLSLRSGYNLYVLC